MTAHTLTPPTIPPYPAFDVLEVFAGLYAAAEAVEAAQVDEDGTDAVSQAGLLKVLRGGKLPPARVRERNVLEALSCTPQPLPDIVDKLDTPQRALKARLEAMPAVVVAPQLGTNHPSLVWLDAPTIPPADDDAILAAHPGPGHKMPVADLAAALDVDAAVLGRHLCRMDRVFVIAKDGELIVGRLRQAASAEKAAAA